MSEERTEKPTARRMKELRKRGTSARSAEFPMAASLLAITFTLPAGMHRLAEALSTGMQVSLANAGTLDLRQARQVAVDQATRAATSLVPMLVVVGGSSVLASVAVTRSRPNPLALRPKLERLSPKAGLKRFLGVQSLMEVARISGKLVAIIAVSWLTLRAALAELSTSGGRLDALVSIVSGSVDTLLLRAAVLVLFVGLAEAVFARRRYNKQAKMSKYEVREEHKSTEGNPHTKGAIRARQRQLSRSRMIAAVAKADVVLVNPTHVAVALSYPPGSGAPVVLAKGAGAVAARIKEEAAKHSVPVMENKPLARALWRACEVGDVIPADLYEAVARVLAVVFAARRRHPRRTA